MIGMKLDYNMFKKPSNVLSVKQGEIKNTKCPRCKKEFNIYYEDISVLKFTQSHGKICAYCLNEVLNHDDSDIEDAIPYINGEKNLIILNTGTNTAIQYYEFEDEKYFNNNFINPYYYYCFLKQIQNNFIELENFHDYFWRYVSLNLISQWEETEEYENEILILEDKIKKRFDSNFILDNYILDKVETLSSKLFNALIGDFKNAVTCFKLARDDQEKRKQSLNTLLEFIDGQKWEIYSYKGQKYDLNQMFIGNSKTDADNIVNYFKTFIKRSYRYIIIEVYYYNFKYNYKYDFKFKNDNYKYSISLLKCFNNIDDLLNACIKYPSEYQEKNINYEGTDEGYRAMERIVQRLTEFESFYENEFQQIRCEGGCKLSDNMEYNSELSRSVFDNENKGFTEMSLGKILNEMNMPLSIFHKALRLLKDILEKKESKDHYYKHRVIVYKCLDNFTPIYEKFINILYKNSSSIESNTVKWIDMLNLMSSLTDDLEMIHDKKLSIEEIENLFSDKKMSMVKYFPEEYHEQLEVVLFRYVKALVNIITSSSDDEMFLKIKLKLDNELDQLKVHLPISAYKSLVTAEYLYDLLITIPIKKGIQINDDKDYSCISIMYYMALEDLLKKKMAGQPIQNIMQEWYMSVDIKVKWMNTLSHFGTVFQLIEKERFKNVFIYLKTIINNDLYNKDADLKIILCKYGGKLQEVTKNRNDAAHGGNIINFIKVQEDKKNIYFLEKEDSCKKLLFEFLKMLK